jgi:hypothetical protein
MGLIGRTPGPQAFEMAVLQNRTNLFAFASYAGAGVLATLTHPQAITFFTNRLDIKVMFFGIAIVMVIALCWIATIHTHEGVNSRNYSTFRSVFNPLSRSYPIDNFWFGQLGHGKYFIIFLALEHFFLRLALAQVQEEGSSP